MSFSPIEEKMKAANVAPAAIAAFKRNYETLLKNESGMISEEAISPAKNIADWSLLKNQITPDSSLLDQCVVIKLNGGLGTSMGLQAAKSLLAVRDGATFLDIIAQQIIYLRKSTQHHVRLLLMNSFSTSEDTMNFLTKYEKENLSNAADVELMQNQIPKLDAATKLPVTWSADEELEWCPPGHGDIYPALVGSGWLEKLLATGVKYAFISNSDNLGATLEPELLTYFAKSNAPFLMEVTRRTAADRKGGHLAVRKSDSQLLLREVAQCPAENLAEFQNIEKHQYFNTNNLWLRLDVLQDALTKNDGVLPLPMIINKKTVDPRDKNSTAVIQLETAMGAAIECFPGAAAIDVPRSRFAPVKTTADLFALRSDAYEIKENGSVALKPERQGTPPDVTMDDNYKLVDSIEAIGAPSLFKCTSLTIVGKISFAENVTIIGDVTFSNKKNEGLIVSSGTYENQRVEL